MFIVTEYAALRLANLSHNKHNPNSWYENYFDWLKILYQNVYNKSMIINMMKMFTWSIHLIFPLTYNVENIYSKHINYKNKCIFALMFKLAETNHDQKYLWPKQPTKIGQNDSPQN